MARKLLIVGPAMDGSSYSRVVQSVFAALAPLLRKRQPTWEIEQFGINLRAPAELGWHVIPNPLIGDRLGLAQLPELVGQCKPDLVWLFNCYTVLPRYAACLAAMSGTRPKVVAYCPLLGKPLQLDGIKNLAGFDALVTISPSVQTLFESVLHAAHQAGELAQLPQMSAIPHGYDQALFYPLSQPGHESVRPWAHRDEHKLRVFGDRWADEQSFVVLNANRNSPRKHIETTLEGFAQFARDKPPGVRLYLHMAESMGGETLAALAKRLGIPERVRVAGAPGQHPLVSDAQLNLLYNACDVGINTASAEGFGMVSLEHAATGAPQIVPGHGVCGEVWQDHADVLASEHVLRGRPAEVIEHRPVSAESVANALERLYRDPAHYQMREIHARRLSQDQQFHWLHIATQWLAVLEQIVPDATN